MSSIFLGLFFLVVVLAMVWIAAGMILRQWEGSRWRRRWSVRIREEWERADRLVRTDPEEDEGLEEEDEGLDEENDLSEGGGRR